MHTGQLIEKVLDALGDPEGIRYGVDFVCGKLMESQTRYLRKTNTVLQTNAVLSPDTDQTPDTAFFTLPSDLVQMEELYLEGYSDPLPILTNPVQAERHYSQFATIEGTPRFGLYGPYGKTLIRLVPYPTEIVYPTLFYIRRAADLRTAMQPDVPEEHQLFLVHDTVAWVMVNDRDYYDQNTANFHRGEADDILGDGVTQAAYKGVRRARSVNYRRY